MPSIDHIQPIGRGLRRHLALCAVAMCFATGAARAEPLPVPTGPVVLTIEGAISDHNVEDTAQFDLAMLKSLGEHTIFTTTIWTEGRQRFDGVLLADLLAAVGAEKGEITASAANEYRIEIPATDATDPGPIIAYARNGTEMTLREKGPLWVIYPYDDDPAWQTEVVYSRSIWQLDHISIAPAPGASD